MSYGPGRITLRRCNHCGGVPSWYNNNHCMGSNEIQCYGFQGVEANCGLKKCGIVVREVAKEGIKSMAERWNAINGNTEMIEVRECNPEC